MSDDEATRLEGIISIVRNEINQTKIRLWETPYYSDGKPKHEEMSKLASQLAATLNLGQESVLSALQHLQTNALEKLSAREKLKNTGKVVLKLKFAKNVINQMPKTIEIDPSVQRSSELAESVGKLIDREAGSLRLISGGKVLSGDLKHLKPGAVIMVVFIDPNDQSLQIVGEQHRILETTKNDARILGEEEDTLQITDQSGKTLELPGEERAALIIAMSLHEKGRAALKRGDFSLALIFLLEADQEYENCRSTLLESVDNYALLNLDIAWCYLNLKQIRELPEAENRLQRCERSFNKSYGSDLQRLRNLKGSTGNEAVLYMRLHLLQGITAFHRGETEKARSLFQRVQNEISILDVSADSIEELKALGFTEREARLGLRACHGNVPEASSYICEKRHRKAEIMKREKEERKRKIKQKKLGKTVDGKSYVNLGYYNTMIKMGYPEKLTGIALRQTNNDMSAAMDAIQNQPDMLMLALNEDEKRKIVTDEVLAQVTSMGFEDIVSVRKALFKYGGNVERAVHALTIGEDLTSGEDLSLSDESNFGEEENIDNKAEKMAREKEKEEAYLRMKEELGESLGEEEDHLDLTMEEEIRFLKKYQSYLS